MLSTAVTVCLHRGPGILPFNRGCDQVCVSSPQSAVSNICHALKVLYMLTNVQQESIPQRNLASIVASKEKEPIRLGELSNGVPPSQGWGSSFKPRGRPLERIYTMPISSQIDNILNVGIKLRSRQRRSSRPPLSFHLG